MRNFKVIFGKKVKGFKSFYIFVPNLKNDTREKIYFIQVPYLCFAFFMGYKLVN